MKSVNPWAIALTVTLATFMEVLDTSIANVALPHIAGNLGASQSESTWVLTSYLVSNAIILPISAWLARLFGRKRFYMSCVVIFTAASFLCGLAPSLGMLVIFRVLQGLGGGGLQPSEQAILADTFSPKQRGMAFAIYGMAIVVAPAIGPVLGGWITDHYSWRWIFYINVPVGALSLYLTHRLVQDPPYLEKERAKTRHRPVDWPGLGLIALGIACIQLVLDKGQEKDWFATPWITVTLAAGILMLVIWAIWEWHHPDPIVDVKLYKNRNFSAAMFFTFVLGVVLFGSTVIIPQFLQSMLNYPATSAGLALAGGGFIMMLMMPIAGMLVSRMDPRWMMVFGFATLAASLNHMATHMTLGIDFGTAAMLRTYQTLGLAFIFIPSNTLAYQGIPKEKNNQVSSLTSFTRNIGGSIGIALLSTMLERQTQKHQSYLAAHIAPGNAPYEILSSQYRSAFRAAGADPALAQAKTLSSINHLLGLQALNLGYVDVISGMAVLVLCLIPFIFILRRPKAISAVDVPLQLERAC